MGGHKHYESLILGSWFQIHREIIVLENFDTHGQKCNNKAAEMHNVAVYNGHLTNVTD